jgi:hypothetical protein
LIKVDSTFPPTSTRSHEIDDLAAVFGTVRSGRTAIYVSTPLTTGPRFSSWRGTVRLDANDPTYRSEFRRHVVEPNTAEARRFAEKLREVERRVVIDPGALPDIDEWTQDDYRVFWGRVIERNASTVVFRDGWEHSRGCSYEFLVAAQSGAELLDARLEPLSLDRGLELLRLAIKECEDAGMPATFLSQVSAALQEVAGMEDAGR